MIILGSPFMFGMPNLIDTITSLGLTSSLQLCLDAGDANSYTSGQIWSDVSGNSNHFYRGSGSGSESNDPTFNGVAGRQSSAEYFSSDGGDAFWNTATHSFPANWHKDNATLTAAFFLFIPNGSTEAVNILCNIYDADDRGVSVVLSPSSSKMGIQMARGVGPSLQTFLTSDSGYIVTNQWMFVSLSFSEGSGQSFVNVNGVVHTLSSDTYSSPSSSAPTKGTAIWSTPNTTNNGTDTDTGFLPDNGSRIAEVMAWNRALSQAELASLYAARKSKFGL